MKNGDIKAIFNAMKPERYKVKSINEVAQTQKESDIMHPLNLGQKMELNKKASNFLKKLCADIDFSKAGYRPPLKEPLILAKLDDETMKSLEILGYKLESNELKVSTQKQLFHGMRLKKIADGRALSKTDFLEMTLHINNANLYVGLNEYRQKEIRFFWDIDFENDKAKYVYFNLNCELGTYGITNINTIKSAIKVER